MKKSLIYNALILFLLAANLFSSGQNSVKLRISANSTTFYKEPQGAELLLPQIITFADSLGPFPDFTNKSGLGFQAEVMTSLSSKIWLGFEIGTSMMNGENDNPGLFNFQYSDLLQLNLSDTILGITRNAITNYPLKYKTTLINILGNIRFYPVPGGRIQPFIKASAGLSLVSTELSLKSPEMWYQDLALKYPDAIPGTPVLFSQGTKEAPRGLFPAFTFGGGVGVEFQVNDKISVYADGTYMIVNADIVDGIPNMDYYEASGMLDRFNTRANTGRISLGITYTLGDNFSFLGGGGKSKSKGGKGGRTSPNLPFYKLTPR
jgi:hypothetical protein